jgi:hypothetical protein
MNRVFRRLVVLRNTGKTDAVSGSPLQDLANSFPIRWRAAAAFALLRNTRKTGVVSGSPPQDLANSFPIRWRAAAAFALLRNTRKTGVVSGSPPQDLANSFPIRWRAAAAFALLRNTRKTGGGVRLATSRSSEFLSHLVARVRALCASMQLSRTSSSDASPIGRFPPQRAPHLCRIHGSV